MRTTNDRLDSLLTGLAFADAYYEDDSQAIASLLGGTDPVEAILSVLESNHVLSQILVTGISQDVAEVRRSLRQRIVREIAREEVGA